jgi:biopolymer transport protein ExbB/TolQ
MFGLMGTLIPLGPGLAALGRGDVASLANAVTVAFDTTVLGLAVGIVGFCLARARRSHYDRVFDRLDQFEQANAAASEAQ